MIKKKFFSFQYLSSDRLHQINFSVLNILASFALILIIFIGANYYLSVGFSNQYYQDKLKETDEKYADVSQELLTKITQLEQELLLIEERDKELRTYAAIPPLSEDIKIQGTGGSVEETSIEDKDATSILFQLKDKIDSLSYTVNLEKDSYSTIFNKIKSNEKMYSHTPSISPVEAYLGSGYGYRTDPIDGKRRMHRGLDFAVNLNTDVVATGDGVVKKAARVQQAVFAKWRKQNADAAAFAKDLEIYSRQGSRFAGLVHGDAILVGRVRHQYRIDAAVFDFALLPYRGVAELRCSAAGRLSRGGAVSPRSARQNDHGYNGASGAPKARGHGWFAVDALLRIKR